MLCRGLLLPDATIIEVSATATMARATMTNQSLTTKHGPPCGGRGLWVALAAGCGQGRAEPGAAAGVPILLPDPAHREGRHPQEGTCQAEGVKAAGFLIGLHAELLWCAGCWMGGWVGGGVVQADRELKKEAGSQDRVRRCRVRGEACMTSPPPSGSWRPGDSHSHSCLTVAWRGGTPRWTSGTCGWRVWASMTPLAGQ